MFTAVYYFNGQIGIEAVPGDNGKLFFTKGTVVNLIEFDHFFEPLLNPPL